MAQNPLQQYFRQPKIFISLPSHGVYNKPGFIDGDIEHIPVFGMTGMDEILVKTPDALLSGESTVKVVASCCPAIRNPWDLTVIDLDVVLTAIRIATYGNKITVGNICSTCGTDTDYDFDLAKFIDYYSHCKYNNKVIAGDLTITLKPVTYKQSSEFSLRNFQLQQQLKQIDAITDDEEKNSQLTALYAELAKLQNEILITGIEAVDVAGAHVTEKGFINEWMENCDASVIESIREVIGENQKNWRSPEQYVECSECGTKATLNISLDQSDFFVTA